MNNAKWDVIRSAAASAHVDQSWYTEKTIALFPVSQADGALLVACRPANLLSLLDDYDALAADNQRLLEALATARYRIEQGRVWNGMGWTLTGMHPLNQQKAIDAIDAALAVSKECE